MLRNILYFDEVKEHAKYFKQLAETLINRSLIKIADVPHRILELEIYFWDDVHQDPFIHKDPAQKIPLGWYFHRQKGGSYKGGTFKGVDITFGYKDIKKDFFGGILIRSIQNLNNNNVVIGPCNFVNYILKMNGCDSIENFLLKSLKLNNQPNGLLEIFNKNASLLYIEDSNMFNNKIFSGPRIGLTLKDNVAEKAKYIVKNYRYLIYPSVIKKNIFGIVINEYIRNNSPKKIADDTKIKQSLIEGYIEKYNCNRDCKIDDFKGKILTPDDIIALQRLNKIYKHKVFNIKKENLNKYGYENFADWLKDENHLYIGREMVYIGAKKSKWCNNYSTTKHKREDCIELFKKDLLANEKLLSEIGELKGKVLGCYCHPLPCHGNVLVEMLKNK